MTLTGDLLMLAARDLDDECGTCFIHPEGKEPTLVMLTWDQYRRMEEHMPHPWSGRDWNHSHVEPEMLED